MTDLTPSANTHALEPAARFANWQQYLFPIDWRSSFAHAADAPAGDLHLEIGFGDGRYTAFRAQELPQERFVGVELSGASIHRARKRVAALANVKLLKTNAQFAVQHLFAPHSLRSITVNFPDPWPKEKHTHHRLLRVPFLTLAASRLQAGGEVRLATDHPAYFEQARTEALETGLYRLENREPPAAVFETKYALKWRAKGNPLYYQVFARNDTAPPSYPILQRSQVMAHALLTGSLPTEMTFAKIVSEYADGHVILHEVTRSISDSQLLIRATIDEHNLRQQVLVSARAKDQDTIIVSLEPFGDPLVTEVCKGAVHAVCEWLMTQSDVLRVRERCY